MHTFPILLLLITVISTIRATSLSRGKRGLVPGTGWSQYHPEEQQIAPTTSPQVLGTGWKYYYPEEKWASKVSGHEHADNYEKPTTFHTNGIQQQLNGYEQSVNPMVHQRLELKEGASSPSLINREGYRIKSKPGISTQALFSPAKEQHFSYPQPNLVNQAALCPQNYGLRTNIFAYSKIHSQCFRIGTKGPCKQNMRFYSVSAGSEFGDCDCDVNTGYHCGRPLIYSVRDDWCYPVNSQGPCAANEWFVLDWRGQPLCESNNCIQEQYLDNSKDSDCQHWVSIDGRCYETSRRNFCQNHEILYWDIYNSKSTEPKCSPIVSREPHLNGRFDYSRVNPASPCLPGQKQTIFRKCSHN